MKKVYKRIFVLFLLLVASKSLLISQTGKESCTGKIILWHYNKHLTYDYLNTHTFEEVKEKFKIGVEIDFDEFESFDEKRLEFIFKPDSKYKNNILYMCDDLYELSDGGTIFFSIVIDDEIYMNGLDRVSGAFWGAAMHVSDDYSIVSIAYAINDTLRLTYDHSTATFIIENADAIREENNIKRDKIVEVFNNRKMKK